jgi:hypothetical protein
MNKNIKINFNIFNYNGGDGNEIKYNEIIYSFDEFIEYFDLHQFLNSFCLAA